MQQEAHPAPSFIPVKEKGLFQGQIHGRSVEQIKAHLEHAYWITIHTAAWCARIPEALRSRGGEVAYSAVSYLTSARGITI